MGVAILVAVAVALLSMQPVAEDRVILLPDADGKVGAVTVQTAGGERLLDRPYAAANVDAAGAVAESLEDAAAVRQRYAGLLAAQPPRPVSFVLYFVSGSDELTVESKPLLEQIKAESARRAAAEIVAIGHTDRVGSIAANDALSLKRAETVRAALQAAGIAAPIETAGRGEREPLVATADEVAEPRNRRVEISIR